MFLRKMALLVLNLDSSPSDSYLVFLPYFTGGVLPLPVPATHIQSTYIPSVVLVLVYCWYYRLSSITLGNAVISNVSNTH